MRLAEKILAIIIIVALLLKFNLIRGGDFLLMWSTLLLSCIYFPLGFLFFSQIRLRDIFKKEAYSHTTSGRIVLAILSGLSFSTICIGALFRLLHFSGASQMLVMGLGEMIIVLVAVLALFLAKKSVNMKPFLIRSIAFGIVAIVLLGTTSLSIVRLQYRNHRDYVKAYEDYINDPRNPELERIKEREYYRVILSKEEFELYGRSVNK